MNTPGILVYVAGPYRAPTPWGVERNIQRAREYGARIAAMGKMPVVPHANTAHYEGIQKDSFWLEGTLTLMRRCDAVFVMPGSEGSEGVKAEIAEARRNKIRVFTSLEALEQWPDTSNF